MSLVVGVANEVVAGGNEGVMEDEEEGGGEVFKADKGESGRWFAGDSPIIIQKVETQYNFFLLQPQKLFH